MKKLTLISGFLLMSLVLGGCGSSEDETTDESTTDATTTDTTTTDSDTDTTTTTTDSDTDTTTTDTTTTDDTTTTTTDDDTVTNESLSSLLRVIPSELVIASNTAERESDESQSPSLSSEAEGPDPEADFEEKKEALDDVLSDETIAEGTIADCIAALPGLPPTVSPQCYGPSIDYTNHPDYDSNQVQNEFSPGEDGQLPTGDLGLWVEVEPNSNTACSAAKLNDLVAKAAYNVDLAIGTMAMMVCAAAIEEEELPTTEGESIDLSNILGTDVSIVNITSATITREDFDDDSEAYTSEISGTISSNSEAFSITVRHSPETETGLLQLERGSGEKRGVSVVYDIGEDSMSYKLVSAQFRGDEGDAEVAYADDGQITLQTKDDVGNPPITEGNDGDVHVMIATVDLESGHGNVAYGWNAGGRDDHYRVLNVMTSETSTTTDEVTTTVESGHAYYGYAPSPSSSTPEVLDLDLSQDDAGMICNWAGPGNSHTTTESLQYQELLLTEGDWAAEVSNVLYAPTTTCDLESSSNSTFTPTLDVFEGEGSLSGDVTNELWSKTGTFEFTMPTAPSSPVTAETEE